MIILLLFARISTAWLVAGFICWLLPMFRAYFFYGHDITKLDITMLVRLTLGGFVSVYQMIKVIRRCGWK